MRAKFVNEKFEEENDPIKDMNIGVYKLLEPYAVLIPSLESKPDSLGKILEKYFNLPMQHIYYLYDDDTEDNKDLRTINRTYASNFRQLIKNVQRPDTYREFISSGMHTYIAEYSFLGKDFEGVKIVSSETFGHATYWGNYKAALILDIVHNVKV